MDTLATTCRSTFHRCSAQNPQCSPDATCVPILDDLTCSKPPCMACICGAGLMGDGLTCVEQPVFEVNDVPADVASGSCIRTVVDGPAVAGTIAGSPLVYCLVGVAGTQYTINVGLQTLSDSVVELWDSSSMLDSNDDYGGSLGSQLTWTAPADGRVYVLVRGYSTANNGDFTLTISTANGGTNTGCIGCLFRGTCRDLATFPTANSQECTQNGGVWNGGGSACTGGSLLMQDSGSISFTDSYDTNAQCSWTITCSNPRQVPTLIFSSFDTETNFDFVNLYAGTATTGVGIVEPMSGHSMPDPAAISSTQQSMTLVFTSDGSVAGPGFAADWECAAPGRPVTPPSPPGSQILSVPGHVAGEVRDGGQRITWSMQATGGTTYQIESSAAGAQPISDTYLTIYDADGTELAHDDDSGQGTQALLTWTCPATGTYTVEVRGFSRRQTGTFELDAQEAGGAGGNSPCSPGGGLQLQGSGSIAFADSTYVNNAACSWTITCGPNQHVNFQITSLNTERNFDWVQLFDGPVGSSSLARVSGTMDALPTTEYQTNSNTGSVQFTTDGSVTAGGFDVSYDCSSSPTSGGGGGPGQCNPIRVDSRPQQGTVLAPRSPTQFCLTATGGMTYELTVELLTLRDSVMSILDADGNQIERNDDDGGSLASHLIWTAPRDGQYTVQIEGFGAATGDFTLEVQSVSGGDGGTGGGNPCAGGITLTDDSASIDFDDTGVTGATCDWIIRCNQGSGVTFTFDDLSVESNFDYVSIYAGGDSGASRLVHATGNTAPPPNQITGHVMLIEYTSDGSINRGGFAGSYTCGTTNIEPGTGTIVAPDAPAVSGTVSTEDGVRYTLSARGGVTYQLEVTLGSLSDSVLELYAPNGRDMLVENDDYGGALSSYIEWTCPNDGDYFVVVRGWQDRGSDGGPPSTGSFTLAVTTDGGSAGGSGGDPCNGGINLNVPSAVISYQPRGQYENNANCVWAITCPNRGDVPSFTFTALDTENGFDYVAIEDGNALTAGSANMIDQVSGSLQSLQRVSYTSGSPSMTIAFSTDGSVTGVGFEGSYACGSPPSAVATCEDTIEELNGRGACGGFLAQGFSCAQRFCPTCTYASMCDLTCGFCAGGTVGNACDAIECSGLSTRACANQDSCCSLVGGDWEGNGRHCVNLH